MPAADLRDAALLSWSNSFSLAALGTLKSHMIAFIAAIKPSFQDAIPGDRPTLNWIAILNGYTAQMQGGAFDWTELRISVDYLYRLLFMTFQQDVQGNISPAQNTVVLNAFNAQFP